ncbi:MAG: Uma2 family endonuclease [candidate division WOR-3 bacterium]
MKEMVKERIWTYEDYLKLEDDKRYEVINGRLVEMPALNFEHQRILIILATKMRNFVEDKGLGEIIPSPFDVIISKKLVVQPDIVFISNENLKNIKEGRLFGIPDLVAEIVSPGSYKRDRYEKFSIYEEYNVREYWIVLPGEKAIEVWCLKEGKYVLHSIAVEKGEVESCLLKGLKVKVEEVFK